MLACPSIFVLWRCVGCVGSSIMFGHKIKVIAATGRSPAIWFSGQKTLSMIFDRCDGALPKAARHCSVRRPKPRSAKRPMGRQSGRAIISCSCGPAAIGLNVCERVNRSIFDTISRAAKRYYAESGSGIARVNCASMAPARRTFRRCKSENRRSILGRCCAIRVPGSAPWFYIHRASGTQ